MRKPLMPKATASWLIENTALSFKQISELALSNPELWLWKLYE